MDVTIGGAEHLKGAKGETSLKGTGLRAKLSMTG